MSTTTHVKSTWCNPRTFVVSTTTTPSNSCVPDPTVPALIGTNLIQDCIDISNKYVSINDVAGVMIISSTPITTVDFATMISVLTPAQQLVANTLLSLNKVFYTSIGNLVSNKAQIEAFNWLDTNNFYCYFAKNLGSKITAPTTAS